MILRTNSLGECVEHGRHPKGEKVDRETPLSSAVNLSEAVFQCWRDQKTKPEINVRFVEKTLKNI